MILASPPNLLRWLAKDPFWAKANWSKISFCASGLFSIISVDRFRDASSYRGAWEIKDCSASAWCRFPFLIDAPQIPLEAHFFVPRASLVRSRLFAWHFCLNFGTGQRPDCLRNKAIIGLCARSQSVSRPTAQEPAQSKCAKVRKWFKSVCDIISRPKYLEGIPEIGTKLPDTFPLFHHS